MKTVPSNRPMGLIIVLFGLFLTAGCQPVPMQPPPGPSVGSRPTSSLKSSSGPSTRNPPPPAASQPPLQTPATPSGSGRWDYAWDRAIEGTAMGASIAGPYGAGGGLIVGLITGLFTADAHYQQLNDRIKAEEEKDKQLEAQLEKEIARQRQLEEELEKQLSSLEPEAKEDKPHTDENIASKKIGRDQLETIQREKTGATTKFQSETSVREPQQSSIGPLVSIGDHDKQAPAGPKTARPHDPISETSDKTTARDVNQDGKMDLWIHYDPLEPTMVQRQEEDTDWDGSVDTWSFFTAGKLIQREVDTNRDGVADRWFFYENDSLVREERDRDQASQPAFRALYTKGRLAKVEKDLDKNGRMDFWITYDTDRDGEVVLKEEQDLNGNGHVDVWSFYEDRRLVRRDVTAVGLEHLMEKEKSLSDPTSESFSKG